MPVYKIENNVVVFVWDSINSLKELKNKYGLEGSEFHVGVASPGQVLTKSGEFKHPVNISHDNAEIKANAIRIRRDTLLSESDWTQLPDIPKEIKNVWKIYRQELRDITKQPEFPNSIVWPSKP